MGHTPGRGHRRKSDPHKKRRFEEKAKRKRDEADRRYDEASRIWEGMSEDARRMCPEFNPDFVKPRWR
jgi:hypothetical protein